MSPQRIRRVVREVNAAIVELEERFGREGDLSVLCECGALGCIQRLVVPTSVYDEIRGDARRFIVAPGHDASQGGDTLLEDAGYRIVTPAAQAAAAQA